MRTMRGVMDRSRNSPASPQRPFPSPIIHIDIFVLLRDTLMFPPTHACHAYPYLLSNFSQVYSPFTCVFCVFCVYVALCSPSIVHFVCCVCVLPPFRLIAMIHDPSRSGLPRTCLFCPVLYSNRCNQQFVSALSWVWA